MYYVVILGEVHNDRLTVPKLGLVFVKRAFGSCVFARCRDRVVFFWASQTHSSPTHARPLYTPVPHSYSSLQRCLKNPWRTRRRVMRVRKMGEVKSWRACVVRMVNGRPARYLLWGLSNDLYHNYLMVRSSLGVSILLFHIPFIFLCLYNHRISMPSEFLNPYSILELCAVRYLSRFDSLLTYVHFNCIIYIK